MYFGIRPYGLSFTFASISAFSIATFISDQVLKTIGCT
jgi:hypothetical protein